MANQKRRQKKKFRARMVLFVPMCLCLVIILGITIGKYWVDIVSKYHENNILMKDLQSLKEKEAALTVDVEKLQDPEYIARYAREKYLYSKDGEVIIRIPDEDK